MFRDARHDGSFYGDMGKYRDGVNQDRNFCGVGDAQIVFDECVFCHRGFVEAWGADERGAVAETGGVIGVRDCLDGGFGAGPGDEFLAARDVLERDFPLAVDFAPTKQNGFAG